MYIIGCQVYEDEEIVMVSSYSSIYDQNPDEYIYEDEETLENEYDKMAVDFMEKMNIRQTSF